MKSYWDLSNQERLALTEDELNNVWLKREAAAQGLLVPKEPDLPELPPHPKAVPPEEKIMFVVEVGYEGDNSYTRDDFHCMFETLKQAESFVKLNPCGKSSFYDENSRYLATAKPVKKFNIQTVTVVDEEAAEQYRETMKEYTAVKSHNASVMRDYRKKVDAIAAATAKVRDNWLRLKEHHRKLEEVIENLGSFVEIAEGDINMAIKFMIKTVPAQLVYDALNEVEHGYEWDVTRAFHDQCLQEDMNPYRAIGKALF